MFNWVLNANLEHRNTFNTLKHIEEVNLVLLVMKLTVSRGRSLSYRSQSLQSKAMDWFLYDRSLHHQRVKQMCTNCFIPYLNYFFYGFNFGDDKCFIFHANLISWMTNFSKVHGLYFMGT